LVLIIDEITDELFLWHLLFHCQLLITPCRSDQPVQQPVKQTLGMEMAAGRAFSEDFSTDSSKIIFNEAAIEVMGLRDPVGKTVKLWGEDRQIVGVVKNLHFESLHEKVKPMLFVLDPAKTWIIVATIEAGREQEVIGRLQEFYAAFNPGFTFDYKFLDAAYQAQYESEQRVSVLARYFAGLAILISCLGLYGLAAFAAEQRTKEIGIRKVLGASVANIMGLLSRDFVKLVAIAFGVGSALA
jgi:putative ABC transport system permease protein